MVTSLTALRTRIKLRYGVSANKTPRGLFVPIKVDKISTDDALNYKVAECQGGTLWRLPASFETEYIKPLPRTKSAFLTRALSQNILDIVSSKTYTDIYPELLEPLTHSDPTNSGYGSYICYTAHLVSANTEYLLQNLTYAKVETEDATEYHIYFCTAKSRQKQIEAANILASIATFLICNAPEALEDSWKEVFARFGTLADMKRALEQGVSIQMLLDNCETEWA